MCDRLKKWRFPLIGFAVVTGLWLYFGGYGKAMGDGSEKFDALNSLFAGLAFVGMLCTLCMQRQELSLQRDELTATREELAMTRVAAQEQADIQTKTLLLNTASVQMTEISILIDKFSSNLSRAREDRKKVRDNSEESKKLSKYIIEARNRLEKAMDKKTILNGRINNLEDLLLPLYKKNSPFRD